MTEVVRLPSFGGVSPIRRISITQPSFVQKPSRAKSLQASDPTLASSARSRHVGFAPELPQIGVTQGSHATRDTEDIGAAEDELLLQRVRGRTKSMAVERMPSVHHGKKKRASVYGMGGARRSSRRRSVRVNLEDINKMDERELMREAMNFHAHRGPDWPEGFVGLYLWKLSE